LLVLPALVFLAAATLRLLQPVQHQPAATAEAIVRGFAKLFKPVGMRLVVFLMAPLLAFALAAYDQWLRWRRDETWRVAALALAAAFGRVVGGPLAVVGALALLGSALWLTLLVVHGIFG
jgi:hypothetical protein